MFVLNGSDLKPTVSGNFLDKYADDTYLIVSSAKEGTILQELQANELRASENNLKLNKNKSLEMVVYQTHVKGPHDVQTVSPISDIVRVKSIKILGVTVQDNL